jgi:hypothetical protein
MMIVADRNTGSWTNNQINETHAYALYLSAATGNIEFSSRGPGGYFTKTLVEKPYLERWYHLAVVRSGSAIKGYVDASRVMDESIPVGDCKSTDGMSMGGFAAAILPRNRNRGVFRGICVDFVTDDKRCGRAPSSLRSSGQAA